MSKKTDPIAYRNKVMRDVIRIIAPTAIGTNLSPQRAVGFAKIIADLAAQAALEPILSHAEQPTPAAHAIAQMQNVRAAAKT